MKKKYSDIIIRLAYFISFLGILTGITIVYLSYKNTIKSENDTKKLLLIEQNKIKAINYLNDGINFAHKGYLNEAINQYLKAFDQDSSNGAICNYLGYAYYRLKKYNLAKYYLEKSIILNPNSPWNYYNCALVYWEINKKDEAIDLINKIIKIDPSFKEIIKNDIQYNKFKSDNRFNEILGKPN